MRASLLRSTVALHIPFDRMATIPYYRQIYQSIRAAILEGRLGQGERVPSTRTLAHHLGISRLPVLNAYEQLLQEGYLIGRTGSGTYVAPPIDCGAVTNRRANPSSFQK